MINTIVAVDHGIIGFIKKYYQPLGRLALFIIFFWFGALKVIGVSPASSLVMSLLYRTLPIIAPATFMVCFGIFEMITGVLFLIRGLERAAIALLFFHLIATTLPLFLLSSNTWQYPFIPTLEGQYIIKNIALIALAMGIGAHLRPFKK